MKLLFSTALVFFGFSAFSADLVQSQLVGKWRVSGIVAPAGPVVPVEKLQNVQGLPSYEITLETITVTSLEDFS